jgi:hypothetical protein
MNKETGIISAAVLALAMGLALSAQAQESSTSVSVPTTENKTTTSMTETMPTAKPSKWGGSVLFLADRPGTVSDTELSTMTYFKASYKASKNETFALVQRLAYDRAVDSNAQGQPLLLDLRLEHFRSGTLMNAEAGLLTRITPPTRLESRRDSHFQGGIKLAPELTWNITPKFGVGYFGDFAMGFYDNTASNYINLVSGAKAGYSFTDKLALAQSIGLQHTHFNSKQDMNHMVRMGQSLETETALSYAPNKTVNLGISILQSAALQEKAIDATKASIVYEKNLALFSPDQTTYEFAGSMSF